MRAPGALLFLMVGVAVPLLVAGAGVAAFLLYRAGYGALVWALIPPGALTVLIAGVGVILGKLAGSGEDSGDER